MFKLILRMIGQQSYVHGIAENSNGLPGAEAIHRVKRSSYRHVPNAFQQRLTQLARTAAVCALLSILIPNYVLAQNSEPGSEFRDCEICPLMVVVPPGSFKMGLSKSEQVHQDNDNDISQHQVTISYQFAVGKFEVTFREWDACVSEGGCSHRPDDENWGQGARPVINVNWEDANEYVDWLSRKTGQQYRLLSESEWEYVARAGTTGLFHFGSTISTDQANYDGNYFLDEKRPYGGKGSGGLLRARTVSVGSFPGNGFGLHDVHGNVWEWVEDCWHDDYNGAPSDGSAWVSSGNCDSRVLRGGSFINGPWVLRSAARNVHPSGDRYGNFGFRIARMLTP